MEMQCLYGNIMAVNNDSLTINVLF